MMAVPERASAKDQVNIVGVPIDCVTMPDALDRMEQFVANGGSHLVVTADASGIAIAQTDPELMAIYQGAHLVTPDSEGVLWAARRKGQPLLGRVSGVELLDRVCALSAKKGYRLYFLGAAPTIAELAAERLRSKHPGCQIVGCRDGFYSPADEDAIVQEIGRIAPDFLFVAMGIPRQEKFIWTHLAALNAKVSMGVGGSFDVFSGRAKRAPILIQKLKLEWLWRTLANPKKIKKASMLPKFIAYVMKERK